MDLILSSKFLCNCERATLTVGLIESDFRHTRLLIRRGIERNVEVIAEDCGELT
ncbi:hypothetical protein WH47_11571 [Habropoda laboriosa]|uniref:Uncharacterized protein n=1 Tax=Habropoda laboriosa TaxID=597456 RepID=A0A0L7R945_9HYME|nr:hypothetical protein WH47_11571 [Habropoda laboriosa]